MDFIRETHKIDMTNVYLVKKYAHLYSFYDLLFFVSNFEDAYIKYIENYRKEWIPVFIPDLDLAEKVRKTGAIKLMKLDKIDIDTYEKKYSKKRKKEYLIYLSKLDEERIKRNAKKRAHRKRRRYNKKTNQRNE